MGGIMSKRKLFKRNKKKKNVVLTPELLYEEPVYMEIGQGRDVSSTGSHQTLPSTDSAFSEPSSTLSNQTGYLARSNLRHHDMAYRNAGSSYVLYDEPVQSVPNGDYIRSDYLRTLVRRDYVDGHDDYDNGDDVSDDHTYISEVSLWNSSSKEEVSTVKCDTRIPLEDVPYMVEAFQPLLEHTVDVMEIIPHLPFIAPHEFVNLDDEGKRVQLLIARIKASDERGKWRMFLHALNLAEYEYIVSLLLGETEDDHSVNRDLLKLFTPQIMNRIDPDEFIDHLFEQRVINERDMEEVKCEKDRRGAIAASFMLLFKVPRRISNWFQVFLDVLSKCGMDDVVEGLRVPEVSVCTETETLMKQTSPPRPRKRKLRGSRQPRTRSTGEDYLTPIYDYYSDAPPSLPARGTSPREHNTLLNQRRTDIVPRQRQSDTALKQKHSDTFLKQTHSDTFLKQRHTTNESTNTTKSENSTKTELDLLLARKNSLMRRVDERKQINRLSKEVKALQKELENLNAEAENVNEDKESESASSNETVTEERMSVAGSLEDIERLRENGDEINLMNGEGVDNGHLVGENNNCPEDNVVKNDPRDDYINSDTLRNKEGQEETSIVEILANLKQELKQDILAVKQHVNEMKDHVTDVVIKSFTSSTSPPAPFEENTYVTVEAEHGSALPTQVRLYTTKGKQYPGLLCPTYHHRGRQYSIDSAIFSEYSPMSDYAF